MKDKVSYKFIGMTVVGEYENLYSMSSFSLLPFTHIQQCWNICESFLGAALLTSTNIFQHICHLKMVILLLGTLVHN